MGSGFAEEGPFASSVNGTDYQPSRSAINPKTENDEEDKPSHRETITERPSQRQGKTFSSFRTFYNQDTLKQSRG